MSAHSRARYERLLRWYPARWRRLHAAVMLDTFEERAEASGQAQPTLGEAWSLRASGAAERASPGVIMVGAAVGMLLSFAPLIVLFSGVITDDPWLLGLRVAAQFIGTLLVSTAAGALLLRAGRIKPEPALVAWALSVGAWTLAGAAVASWGVGFDEADAGVARSWFGDATWVFAGGAWLFGTGALALVVFGVLRAVPSRTLRATLSVLLAVPGAIALGVAALQTGMVLAGAAVVIVVAGFQLGERSARVARTVRTPGVLLPGQRRRIAVMAGVAAVLGVGCVVFALTGSLWFPGVGDSTSAMRVGILSGALVAIITVVAGAEVLHSRRGRAALGPATVATGALLTVAVSYSFDINSRPGWPLLVLAALLAGLTGGLLLEPLLPDPAPLRALLVAVISIALAAALGLIVVTTVAFLAPLVAVILAVSMARRPRRAAALGQSAPPSEERG